MKVKSLQCPLLFIFSVSIGEETEWWKVYEWMRLNTLDFQLLALKARKQHSLMAP